MFCRECGNALQNGEKFCGTCGAKVETETNNSPNSISYVNHSNKKEKNNSMIPIVGIGAIFLIILIVSFLFFNREKSAALGTWNCSSSSYNVTMKLNRNHTFNWNKYEDEKNNYVKGKFKFLDLDDDDLKDIKQEMKDKYSYYVFELTGSEYVVNGKKQNEKYQSKYTMVIGKEDSKEKAVLINAETYNIYYCEKTGS